MLSVNNKFRHWILFFKTLEEESCSFFKVSNQDIFLCINILVNIIKYNGYNK